MNSLSLYLLFIKIGTFTFGGGYAMISLFQDELVTKHGLISASEFADLVALAQITPGPVGLNAATYIGWHQAGFTGAVAGTLGVMTPSLVITLLAACFISYFRRSRSIEGALSGLRPASLALICSAVIVFAQASFLTVGRHLKDFSVEPVGLAVFFISAMVFYFFRRVSVAGIMAFSAAAGALTKVFLS